MANLNIVQKFPCIDYNLYGVFLIFSTFYTRRIDVFCTTFLMFPYILYDIRSWNLHFVSSHNTSNFIDSLAFTNYFVFSCVKFCIHHHQHHHHRSRCETFLVDWVICVAKDNALYSSDIIPAARPNRNYNVELAVYCEIVTLLFLIVCIKYCLVYCFNFLKCIIITSLAILFYIEFYLSKTLNENVTIKSYLTV